MKCDKNHMLLYAVTDRSYLRERTLSQSVKEAIRGGVTCVQLREKSLSDEEMLTYANEIKSICNEYNVPFIVNDNVNVALACKSDGIHIGQHDANAVEVRKLIGNDMILGVSVQTVKQALEAEKNGADYLGVGAVFSTRTKDDADDVSHEVLKQICEAVSIPVVAIGGINKSNIIDLKGTGIDGVALVSAIFDNNDIEFECRELKKVVEKII